jgi:hypothetical protein
VHEAPDGMRASTARWYASHRERLSLRGSLQTVLASYASARS